MPSKKVLIFDISGEYGHFRKFNTTSSPLTYSIPTRPAIVGILGAILGIEREIAPNIYRTGVVPVNELFNKAESDIAVQIIDPIKKTNIGFNLLNTAKGPTSFFNIFNRTQIEFELLKDPKFRIFVTHENETLFNELVARVEAVNHHFTPYLGLAQFTAIVRFQAVTDCRERHSDNGYIPICTAVNLTQIAEKEPIQFEFGNEQRQLFYATDTIPIVMQRDRIIKEYGEVLIERKGHPILVKAKTFYTVNEKDNILFL